MKRFLTLAYLLALVPSAGCSSPSLWQDYSRRWFGRFQKAARRRGGGGQRRGGPEKSAQRAVPHGQRHFYNGPKGRSNDLYTKEKYGDLEVHVEFLIPKGSNSGIKLHGHYEIQIEDSYGIKKPKGSDCGGVYPRAEAKPRYHHIDDGIAPKVNACKPAGEWQTLDIEFVAPRFDKNGKKIANARLPKVLLNGIVIHENVELLTPTGDRWRGLEMAEGPLMLQGDHGPVAFRNLRLRQPQRAP